MAGCVGLIAGLLGIGGGILLIPTMLLLFRFPPHMATATSMAGSAQESRDVSAAYC
uniref:TSUP family transporter n=1 Tax=Paenibacillus albus TaxID=2495582 RepID=UPI001D130E20|nr:TSUP family transporter [Paenibacillus albus]